MRADEYLSIPGYVPLKVASGILGISEDRILQHIHAGRFPSAMKVEGRYLIQEEDIGAFQSNPPGRTRKKPVKWRKFKGRARVFSIQIQVRVLVGQQELFNQKLQQLLDDQEYQFPGTMRRYIFKNTAAPDLVTINLLWKSNEMPGETVRANQLETFQSAFADVLDWDTAQITFHEGLLYT